MKRFHSFSDALAFLESRSIMPVSAPSLEPMRRALAAAPWMAGLKPEKNVIIAGTNGKGSTAATLSALLASAGQRVGLYTSPHLVHVCERFRIAEKDITEELFLAALHANLETIEAEQLTHFEALTLMAGWIFCSGAAVPRTDWNIWEVGLGGLWDATNAIPHQFCAITRLGLDHEGLLGSTLAEIAAQKLGVIPPRGTVVFSPMDPALAPLREEARARTGCRWVPARTCETDGWQALRTPWGEARMALVGARAAENSATALTLFAELGFSPEAHLKALEQVRWPGRFEEISWNGRPVFLSGDHNPQGVESLLPLLGRVTRKRLHLVFGICADKAGAEMASRLLSLPEVSFYLTETPFKTLRLADYPEHLRARAAGADENPARLLSRVAAQAGAGDMVLVTGSLYLVGKILASLPS